VLSEGLRPYLDDTADAWILGANGEYRPPAPRGGGFSAQRHLILSLAASADAGT